MKRTFPSFLLAAALTVLSASAFSSETVYRWVDSKGTPHFSKKPPENVKYETIHTTAVNTADRNESSREDQSQKTDTVDDKYSEQFSKLAKQQKESCRKAKENRQSLLNNHRIQMKDADGNVRTLTHEEKLEQIQRADKGIQDYCD